MKSVSVLISVLAVSAALAGCSQYKTWYLFNYPTFNREAWTKTYPLDRGTQSVKCVFTNQQTGAVIKVVLDPCSSPDAVSGAMSMRHMFENSGYTVGKITPGADRRSVSFTYVRDDELGKVIALRRPNVNKTFLLIGRWPAESHAAASADLDRVASDFDVTTYETPPGYDPG